MDKRIYYLGYYDVEENKAENRNIVLSCANKMTYIISAIEKAGYGVDVISASATKNPQKYDKKTIKIGNKSTLTLFKTLPWGNKIRRVLNVLYSRHQLKKYIKENIGLDDTLMVYHSVAYAKMLCKLKKKKNFKLVLEVEEIYADVNHNEKNRATEYALFNLADAYVFSTELLNDKLNVENKPYSVIYGTYQVEHERGKSFDDGKTHIVYAGTFDPRKGGVQTTLSIVPFLNADYHVHIIGFGTENDKKSVLEMVEKLSRDSICTVTYDGLLSGESYVEFLQKCQIGMSTQVPEGEYNNTSFPSKILSYMSNGLRVVSVRIPVVEKATIGPIVVFYDENDGKKIADVIMSIDKNDPYDSREIIKRLDENFVSDIKKLLL
ncbi:MAG: glycosyltransferase [Clostridia bacterium]|nr:glycosyltransferase [Clostridia bacterium]